MKRMAKKSNGWGNGYHLRSGLSQARIVSAPKAFAMVDGVSSYESFISWARHLMQPIVTSLLETEDRLEY